MADRYAKLMLDQIEGDGLFVRVPAGTEFYIYTLQVFEPKLASVAGLKQGQQPVNSWQKTPTDAPAATERETKTLDALDNHQQLERIIKARMEQNEKES